MSWLASPGLSPSFGLALWIKPQIYHPRRDSVLGGDLTRTPSDHNPFPGVLLGRNTVCYLLGASDTVDFRLIDKVSQGLTATGILANRPFC